MIPHVVVVGGGPAGLHAAVAAASAGARVSLYEEQDDLGGQLRYRAVEVRGEGGRVSSALQTRARAIEAAAAAGVALHGATAVWGMFSGNRLGVRSPLGTGTVRPDAVVLATGSVDSSVPIPGGTLPGVFSCRAIQILLHVHRVRPGRRFAVIGEGAGADEVVLDIGRGGGRVVGRFAGGTPGLRVGGDGAVESIEAAGTVAPVDIVVVAVGRQADPALALMAECVAGYSESLGGFVPKLDETLQTSVNGLFVAGDAAGVCDVETAIAEGRYAGIAAAASCGAGDAVRLAEERARWHAEAGERVATLRSVPGHHAQVDRVLA